MKSIKKISLLFIAILFTFGISTAQVGIQAGYSSSQSSQTNTPLNGFHVGLNAGLDIQGSISLEYALLYNYLTTNKDYAGLVNSTTTAHRLDLPFRVKAGFPIASNVKLSVFGGPNFNFGLSQGTKVEASLGHVSSKNIYKLKTGDKNAYSPFDLQLGAGVGLDFGNFGLRASYDWGMLDRDNSPNVWKNNDLKVGVVYSF